jgi:hypothetical protein
MSIGRTHIHQLLGYAMGKK